MSEHLNPLRIPEVDALLHERDEFLTEFLTKRTYLIKLENQEINVFLPHDQGTMTKLATLVERHETATKTVSAYGQVFFSFPSGPSEPIIRFIV
jgi:hypothetical protein